jgi:signal transduction histidine kinase
MDIRVHGLIRWQLQDVPCPGFVTILSEDTPGSFTVVEGNHTTIVNPALSPLPDARIPPGTVDGLSEVIASIPNPGDSIRAHVLPYQNEYIIDVTLSRILGGRILVVWGDMVSGVTVPGVSAASEGRPLHQAAGSELLDMLSRHDKALEFSSATPSSYSLIGYHPSELSGTSLTTYIHPDDLSRVELACLPLITSPGNARIRYRIRNSCDEYRWVESVFSSLFRSDGTFSVMMASTREMDAIVRAELAARGANAKLNLLNGIIRHDMINQITGLIGYLDILADMVDDKNIQTLIRKEQDIVTLIRRLIDITRDYQGIGLHPPGFINIDALIYKIFSRPEFTDKIDARRSLDGLYVYADRMIERVFLEMVSNSLAYGGEGVCVSFSYEITDEGLIIVMRDSGSGIIDGDKLQIFSRTYQNRRGYGLYLATEILDITGIRIREVGVYGQGARFEIVVPPDGYRITLPEPERS